MPGGVGGAAAALSAGAVNSPQQQQQPHQKLLPGLLSLHAQSAPPQKGDEPQEQGQGQGEGQAGRIDGGELGSGVQVPQGADALGVLFGLGE